MRIRNTERQKAWEKQRKDRNRKYVDDIRARTTCELCGAQPIDWHREEHEKNPGWRLGNMRSSCSTLERIQAEINACAALCRKCHMRADGRKERLTSAAILRGDSQRIGPRICVRCGQFKKTASHGLCRKCYSHSWRYDVSFPPSLYQIPVCRFSGKARNKARVAYCTAPEWTQGHERHLIPWESEEVIEVTARTAAEAYRLLCKTFLPDDQRPIMGKQVIKYFKSSLVSKASQS